MSKINLKELLSNDTKAKYRCIKRVIATSERNPKELYSDIDFFVKLLSSENNVIKWTAIRVIGNLSFVDKKNKVDKFIPRLIKLLNSGKLITANHAIFALTNIVLSKPENKDKMIRELIKIEHYNYDTVECRNIATGKVILALDKFGEQIRGNKKVLEFVRRQTKNTRNATKKRAEKLLKKLTD